jgi:hypothetical protein
MVWRADKRARYHDFRKEVGRVCSRPAFSAFSRYVDAIRIGAQSVPPRGSGLFSTVRGSGRSSLKRRY